MASKMSKQNTSSSFQAQDGNKDAPQPRTSTPERPNEIRKQSLASISSDSLSQDKVDECVHFTRRTWSGRFDFILSCIGYTLGLGNIWRFPYVVYKNGGGAFLLPYFIFVLLCGVPIVYLELCFGQYSGFGPTAIWNISPIFKGVGYGMVVVSSLLSIYYGMVLAWSLYYFFASLSSPLPWSHCGNSWNTPACCENHYKPVNCSMLALVNMTQEQILQCQRCNVVPQTSNVTTSSMLTGLLNSTNTSLTADHFIQHKSPAEEYFLHNVLKASGGLEEVGELQWRLVLCLLLAWFCVFLCLVRGIRSSGKVVYFTVLCPVLLVVVFLGQAVLLEGARAGVIFYLQPQWHLLTHMEVWGDAANQVFISFGASLGGLITLASHNKFSNNCYRDAICLCVINPIITILAGAVIFCILGHMSYQLGTDVHNVTVSGTGLAFIVYPAAVTHMPLPSLWAALFFMLLFTLGVDSLFVLVHAVISVLVEEFPRTLAKYRLLVLMVVCTSMFLLGLPLAAQGGIHILNILDHFVSRWSVLVFGFCECICLTWVYGFNSLSRDVWMMLGIKPGCWWWMMWTAITPLTTVFIFVFTVVAWDSHWYNGKEPPVAAHIVGWFFSSISLIPLPIWAVYAIASAKGPIKKRLRKATQPTIAWCPAWRSITEVFGPMPEYIRSDGEAFVSASDVTKTSFVSGDGPNSLGESQSHPPQGRQMGENIDTGSLVWEEDENRERGNWSGRFDFLMCGLGYCIGLGNVWRFPYLVYKNGGGAFFFPYILTLVLCGLPLFYMELAFGQFASVGPLTIWKVSPLFKGLGYCMVITMFLITIYYNVINAWSTFYFFASMTSYLPWQHCNNTWNTPACKERLSFMPNCTELQVNLSAYLNTTVGPFNTTWTLGNTNFSSANITSTLAGLAVSAENSLWNTTSFPLGNLSDRITTSPAISTGFTNENLVSSVDLFNLWCTNQTNFTGIQSTSPSEEYFTHYMLKLSSGIHEIGELQWHLSLCLLLCWLVTFICLFRGIKSLGKVVYVTVLCPWAILFVLLIRCATLGTGAYLNGIKYYVTPQWHYLANVQVWGDAATQMFFSLGLCMGGLISLSSYNRFHYNCYRDAYLLCIADTATSVFAGFVIFAILGVMAEDTGTDVASVVAAKSSLAFIALPDAVTRLPAASVWSVLFFLMLFTLAADSQFLMVEAVVTALTDEFPNFLGNRRLWLIVVFCVVGFLLGLPMVTRGGYYILNLMDTYVTAVSPLIVGVLMCISLACVYGQQHFSANIYSMINKKPSGWWRMMWRGVTPVVLLLMLAFVMVSYGFPNMENYTYPTWALVLGILTSFFSVLVIPLVAIIQTIRLKGQHGHGVKEALTIQIHPESEWGPALEKHRNSFFLPSVTTYDQLKRTAKWVAQEPTVFTTETSKDGGNDSFGDGKSKVKKLSQSTPSIQMKGALLESGVTATKPVPSLTGKSPKIGRDVANARVHFPPVPASSMNDLEGENVIIVPRPRVRPKMHNKSTQTYPHFKMEAVLPCFPRLTCGHWFIDQGVGEEL